MIRLSGHYLSDTRRLSRHDAKFMPMATALRATISRLMTVRRPLVQRNEAIASRGQQACPSKTSVLAAPYACLLRLVGKLYLD